MNHETTLFTREGEESCMGTICRDRKEELGAEVEICSLSHPEVCVTARFRFHET